MGFLDRLVGDMIERGTGYNARKMVRRVGGKNILLLGGALVGGALLDQKLRGSSAGSSGAVGSAGGSATTVPPRSAASGSPLPPLPPGARAAVPPPPPPSSPAGPPEVEEVPVELLFAIVRTMVAAALADGELSPDERAVIEGRLDEAPFSAEQVERVRKELLLPATPAELAASVEQEDREVLLRFGLLVALAHEGVSETERVWLERLAEALGLDAERAREIEAEIFEDAG